MAARLVAPVMAARRHATLAKDLLTPSDITGKTSPVCPLSDMNHCDVWTAGTDRDREGVWEWSARNEPIVYTAWHRNEPNNGHVGEHCLLLDWFYGWEWNDVRCDAIRACYICEFEL